MSRKTRGSLINPNEVTIVHAVAKTARNLFLLGEDFATRTHNSHRKAWIVDILEFQCSLMAIDVRLHDCHSSVLLARRDNTWTTRPATCWKRNGENSFPDVCSRFRGMG